MKNTTLYKIFVSFAFIDLISSVIMLSIIGYNYEANPLLRYLLINQGIAITLITYSFLILGIQSALFHLYKNKEFIKKTYLVIIPLQSIYIITNNIIIFTGAI